MAQESEKMKVALEQFIDLVDDFCMLAAVLALLKKEEKEPAQKLLSRFLEKYKENELLKSLHQLLVAQDNLAFFEDYYWEPQKFEEGEKYHYLLEYKELERLMKDTSDVEETEDDPWL